jgi:hypothetical protein
MKRSSQCPNLKGTDHVTYLKGKLGRWALGKVPEEIDFIGFLK